MSRIHPTAVIESGAQLDSTVEVGAYSVIGANVRIDAGTKIGPHVVIEGHTTLAVTIRSSSLALLALHHRTRNTPVNRRVWKSVIAIPSANSLPLIWEPRRMPV